jgi:hypothetical protein
MHHAPKIHWQVARLRVHAVVLVGLWLAGVMVCAAWWFTGGVGGQLLACAWVVVLASGVVSARSWSRAVPGSLVWDGKTWAWLAQGQSAVHGDVAVCVDFQRVMLLRFAGASGGVWWLWVAPGEHAVQWRALRRALFAVQVDGASRSPAPGTGHPVDPAPR